MNGDGLVDSNDAIRLLQHSFFPDVYPLSDQKGAVKKSLCVGEDKRVRTADLLNLIQALSQLSYTPIFRPRLQKFLKHICLGLFRILFSSIWECARKTQMRRFWLEMWSKMWSEVSTP